MEGWITLHRKLLEWEWYDDLPTCRLFIHLLLRANFKPCKWHGQTLNEGELITSIGSLSEETGLTERQVRTALDKLKSTGEIDKQTTNKYTLVKVRNYAVYQGYDKQAKASKRQTNDKQMSNKRQTNDNSITKKQRNKETNMSSSSARARESFLKSCPNVLLTDEQADKLLETLSLEEFHEYMEKVEAYIKSGHRVTNPYQTILKFAMEDREL